MRYLFVLLFLAFIIINLIGAGIMVVIESEQDLNYIDSFYMMTMASTSIGFGDVVPKTDGGKTFMSFFPVANLALFVIAVASIFPQIKNVDTK